MESDPGVRDVIHGIVLADGEVVEILGANASELEGPLTTISYSGRSRGHVAPWAGRVASVETTVRRRNIRRHPPTLRAIPADGVERAFGCTAG